MTYYTQQVLAIRERHFPKQCVTDHLVRARRFMDEHCCDTLDLQTISGCAFLSRYHFIRLFKRCYGRTPHKYLTERRMEAAKALLAANTPVAETCHRVGFDSPNTFSATFKKYTGVSPSTWRKRQHSIRLSPPGTPILRFIKPTTHAS
jgi:AraC-like DNA-binding protein